MSSREHFENNGDIWRIQEKESVSIK